MYRNIKQRVRATWKYWKYTATSSDWDWDETYLLLLLEWKLRRMEECFREENIISSRYLKQIKYAIHLLRRYVDDTDHVRLMSEHYKRWGKPMYTYTERFETIYPNGNPEEAHQDLLDTRRRAANKSQEVWARIWKHISKYGQQWWS